MMPPTATANPGVSGWDVRLAPDMTWARAVWSQCALNGWNGLSNLSMGPYVRRDPRRRPTGRPVDMVATVPPLVVLDHKAADAP